MKAPNTHDSRGKSSIVQKRRGNIIVLSAALFVMVLAFSALTVDVGYITLTKTQLQAAADAATLAAAMRLPPAFGTGATLTPAEAATLARQEAVQIAAMHSAGDRSSVFADGQRDVRLGQYQWDTVTASWQKLWGVAPYNLVEVTLRRDQTYTGPVGGPDEPGSLNGDSPLSLFFAPIIGHSTANLSVQATVALLPGVGFRLVSSSLQTAPILPIALDEPSWNDLMNGIGTDNYSYDPVTGAISPGCDGILEVNLYPQGSSTLPPGNRGTVDFGSPNNSTADLSRQILYGLNAYDLSFFGGELRFDQTPITVNGDTGLSAGIEDELTAIKGKPLAIPLFGQVTGPGNNATYTIVKFVGVRIMNVQLTGSPTVKNVMIQPAPLVDSTVIRGESTVLTSDSILAPGNLIP